jgi:archaellum component FlaC
MLGPIFLKKYFKEKNIEETIKTIKNKYNNIEDDIKKLYIKNIKNEEFINVIQNEISNIDDLIQNNNYEYKENICLYYTYLKSLNIIKEIN